MEGEEGGLEWGEGQGGVLLRLHAPISPFHPPLPTRSPVCAHPADEGGSWCVWWPWRASDGLFCLGKRRRCGCGPPNRGPRGCSCRLLGLAAAEEKPAAVGGDAAAAGASPRSQAKRSCLLFFFLFLSPTQHSSRPISRRLFSSRRRERVCWAARAGAPHATSHSHAPLHTRASPCCGATRSKNGDPAARRGRACAAPADAKQAGEEAPRSPPAKPEQGESEGEGGRGRDGRGLLHNASCFNSLHDPPSPRPRLLRVPAPALPHPDRLHAAPVHSTGGGGAGVV